MRLGHPPRSKLRAWLLGADDEKTELHVGTCEQCAIELEIIEAEEGDSTLGQALAQVLSPPVDFVERLEQRVTARLDSRQVLGIMADLFGAGVETSKLLLSEDRRDDS